MYRKFEHRLIPGHYPYTAGQPLSELALGADHPAEVPRRLWELARVLNAAGADNSVTAGGLACFT